MKKIFMVLGFCFATAGLFGQKITSLPVVTTGADASLMYIRSGASGNVISTITKVNLLQSHLLIADSSSTEDGHFATGKMLSKGLATKLSLTDTVALTDVAVMLKDTTAHYVFQAGSGAAADSILFAKSAIAPMGMFRVVQDSLYIVSIYNIRISASDSAVFNVYYGNGMTGVATDSLFTSPQGCGEHQISFIPSKKRTIPPDMDVWIGLKSDQQSTGKRVKEWMFQVNKQTVRQH
jgi:hypothetical protein